jgi:hypothetical protein
MFRGEKQILPTPKDERKSGGANFWAIQYEIAPRSSS